MKICYSDDAMLMILQYNDGKRPELRKHCEQRETKGTHVWPVGMISTQNRQISPHSLTGLVMSVIDLVLLCDSCERLNSLRGDTESLSDSLGAEPGRLPEP